MWSVAILDSDAVRRKTYVEALIYNGYDLLAFTSDMQAINYFIRQRKAPDVTIVDMQWPGSMELVALSALNRLPHLAETKIITINPASAFESHSPQFRKADVCLPAPVDYSQLDRAIRKLVRGPKHHSSETAMPNTRIWWDSNEATFIRWTSQALVFAWPDSTDTAVKMPRGALIRLMDKGIMKIEGEMPAWVGSSPSNTRDATNVCTPRKQTDVLAKNEDPSLPKHVEPEISASNRLKTAASSKRFDKLGIVMRLIRKLSSGNSSTSQNPATQAFRST